jgi:two-component system, cell cycle sensor histidine kinase and response regulator CckA
MSENAPSSPDDSDSGEDSSRQLRKALQKAVGSWGIGHWSWQVDADWVEQDADLRRLFEWSVDSPPMPFSHLMGLLHPSDRVHFIEGIATAKRTGVYSDELFRVILPSGRQRWMLAKGQAIRDPQGVVVQLFGTSIDVTQSKHAEANRERAQKLEALGQLAAGVAHDFNNLLVAIIGNVELAKECSRDGEQQEMLDEAGRAALRARELTGQLLAFGRRQPLRQRQVNVPELLRNTVRLLQRLLPESVEVELEIRTEDVNVLGDASQLEQVLVNLCVNARDAMPDGGSLTIGCFPVPARSTTGNDIAITVTDTGFGIPDDLQARVFDPFFTTKGSGTGLGLSTAYGIVTQHGGTLSLVSDGKRGATFTVCLPVDLDDAPVPSNTPKARAARGNGETILVAEDERPVRTILSRILRRAGYAVLEARDGQQAVDTFRENQGRISLIILDAVMPNKSGGDALTEIRKLRPGIPAVMSSGYSDILASNKELAPGTAFLGKPYEPDDLLRTVREQLDAATSRV